MYFVDGPCGSAKTHAAVRYAHHLARLGKKVLFVQPSIFLISQTLADLASLTPEVRFCAIHGETSEHVIADIIEHLKHTALDGEVLFITHSALMLLPYFHRRFDWHLIIDETPQADWCAEFNVPRTHRLITDCFTEDAEAASLADNRYVHAAGSQGA
jgi:superfamily II DNA or RNA helicase